MLKKSINCKRFLIALILMIAVPVCFAGTASAYAEGEIIGQIPERLTNRTAESWNGDTPIGNAVADAAILATGADIAIMNIEDMYHVLQPLVDITWEDVLDVFPENRMLVLVDVTPAQLFSLLEEAFAAVSLDERECIVTEDCTGWPQIGGFTLQHDASANPGEKVRMISVNGEELDATDTETHLKLVVTDFMASGGYGYTPLAAEDTGISIAEALADLIRNGYDTDYSDTGRIIATGCADNTIISHVPKIGLPIAVLIILIASFNLKWKKTIFNPGEESDIPPSDFGDI